jgi:hypothetical protein
MEESETIEARAMLERNDDLRSMAWVFMFIC